MVSDCRKQTGPPDAGNNLRKSHSIMCHVTKYSMILGVFQQPWPGVSPTAILNEEKALGTKLVLGLHLDKILDEIVMTYLP